jgi:hypothetical protein
MPGAGAEVRDCARADGGIGRRRRPSDGSPRWLLQRAWWAAMLDLVQDPSTVGSILDSLTATANSAQ